MSAVNLILFSDFHLHSFCFAKRLFARLGISGPEIQCSLRHGHRNIDSVWSGNFKKLSTYLRTKIHRLSGMNFKILNTPLLSYGHFLSKREPSNPKVFKLFTNDLKNNSHLFPLGEAKWTPQNQNVYKTFTSRRKKNCKTKKPLHRQQK